MVLPIVSLHTGCHYNDNTKLVWEPNSNQAEYYSRQKETVGGQAIVSDKKEDFVMDSNAPEALNKKTTLIKYFKSYIRAGGKPESAKVIRCSMASTSPANNMTSDMIYVKRWMLTDQAMVFRLSNRVIQVCFFDQTEVILASESRIVTFTDAHGGRRTMPLSTVNQEGGELAQKLMLTRDILSKLIANRDI
jgi:polo-like kinase 1